MKDRDIPSAQRLVAAREAARLSQRQLADETGIAQATLSRIEKGTRPVKVNELVALAWALGCTVSELAGESLVRERVECAARASDSGSMVAMQRELTHYLELDAHLEEQGIPQPA